MLEAGSEPSGRDGKMDKWMERQKRLTWRDTLLKREGGRSEYL